MRFARYAFFLTILQGCAFQQGSITCQPTRNDAGRIARSRTAVAEFKRLNPCPATGKPYGACPGYVVDHVVPLCACGADAPANMQWQTVAAAKEKDREERLSCSR